MTDGSRPDRCDISIVICTHDRATVLEKSLSCLLSCDPPSHTAVELLVVANACQDDTLQMLDALQQSNASNFVIRVLVEPRPGKSRALNLAIQQSTAPVLCFVDDDQHVEVEFIQTVIRALGHSPDYGIICGFLMPEWDGTEADWVHEQGQYYIPIRAIPEYNKGPDIREIKPDEQQPSGGNITLRRSLLDRMPMHFDVDVGPQGRTLEGGEDHDFLLRARQQGGKIIYHPAIRQWHIVQHERLKTAYMLKKAFHRSYVSFQLHRAHRIKPYMIRSLLSHTLKCLFSFGHNRRFYYMIRIAAVSGEIKAAFDFK
ncbi:MAG TPA: glycosyltransferase [Chromatiales bacterium]|nr:glycosyltransferase [Chromatiales bacterium]